MPQQAKAAGLKLRTDKASRPARYFAVQVSEARKAEIRAAAGS
jgi:hypothetical protein